MVTLTENLAFLKETKTHNFGLLGCIIDFIFPVFEKRYKKGSTSKITEWL